MQVQRVLEQRHACVCLAAPYRQIAEEGVLKKRKWQKQSDKPHFGCVAGPDQRKLTVFDRIVMVSEGDQ
jgi:hypothetical protein